MLEMFSPRPTKLKINSNPGNDGPCLKAKRTYAQVVKDSLKKDNELQSNEANIEETNLSTVIGCNSEPLRHFSFSEYSIACSDMKHSPYDSQLLYRIHLFSNACNRGEIRKMSDRLEEYCESQDSPLIENRPCEQFDSSR